MKTILISLAILFAPIIFTSCQNDAVIKDQIIVEKISINTDINSSLTNKKFIIYCTGLGFTNLQIYTDNRYRVGDTLIITSLNINNNKTTNDTTNKLK